MNARQRYVAWRKYEVGFSGVGTTGLDIKPEFNKPRLPWFVRDALDKAAIDYAVILWQCWRKANSEITGEDSGPWPGLPQSFVDNLSKKNREYYQFRKQQESSIIEVSNGQKESR